MASGLRACEGEATIIGKVIIIAVASWSALSLRAENRPETAPAVWHLSLPVVEVADRYPPYADFCRRHPQECDLSGDTFVVHSPDLMRKLNEVNVSVNHEIKFALDASQYGAEEYWDLPASGFGDCEDLALEKRSRLTVSGIASGALRLAFVFHKRHLNSHCILTVETSQGTFILDSFIDEVLRWDQVPYNYEARERTDGLWDRFDQLGWKYEY